MPTIVQTVTGKVTGLWGSARVRGADGKMHPLKLGDIVNKGDVILTGQDGIVQLTPEDSATPPVAAKATDTVADIDRVISQLNQNDPKAATAAGAADGTLGEGLRVDRVVEGVTPLSFEYATAGRDVVFDVSGTAEQPAASEPALSAISNAIVAIEEGPGVGLGLALAPGVPPTATVTVNQLPAVGQITKADGSLVSAGTVLTPDELAGLKYVPPADYTGAPIGAFIYTVSSGGASAVGTATITVTPVNDPPTAVADVASGAEDTPITGNVLSNDKDPDADTLTVTGFTVGGVNHAPGDPATLPGVGTLVINGNGSYTFTPLPNYNGPVPVATYTATDGKLTTSATLTLSVTPVNDPPVAGDDLASTPINTPVTVAVLGNDTDPDGDVLTVSNPKLANPALGTVTLNPDGTLTFTPVSTTTGPVIITYTVTDPNGGTDTATVTVNVGNNTPPDSAALIEFLLRRDVQAFALKPVLQLHTLHSEFGRHCAEENMELVW